MTDRNFPHSGRDYVIDWGALRRWGMPFQVMPFCFEATQHLDEAGVRVFLYYLLRLNVVEHAYDIHLREIVEWCGSEQVAKAGFEELKRNEVIVGDYRSSRMAVSDSFWDDPRRFPELEPPAPPNPWRGAEGPNLWGLNALEYNALGHRLTRIEPTAPPHRFGWDDFPDSSAGGIYPLVSPETGAFNAHPDKLRAAGIIRRFKEQEMHAKRFRITQFGLALLNDEVLIAPSDRVLVLMIDGHPAAARSFAWCHRAATFLERDGLTCGLCIQPLVPKDPSLLACHQDHVVTVLAGGRAALSNLRLTHWECNLERARREAV